MTTTLMDRFVHWSLDPDGDLWGRDERERLRWYEGTVTAAQVQTIVVPWTAVALVWTVGEPVARPLLAVLAVLVAPLVLCSVWVQGKRVDATPRHWSRKRLIISVLLGAPYVAFLVGYLYHVHPESNAWRSSLIGAVLGLAAGAVIQTVHTRRARRRDAQLVLDED